MDGTRADTLARSLTAAGSRRGALAVLSGALGLILGASSIDEAEAKKKCPPCRKRKHGTCKRKKPNGTPCPGFGTCQGGKCVVPVCSGKNYCPITATPP